MHPTQNKKTPLKVLFIFYFIIFFSLKILFKTELSFSEFEKTMPTWFLAVPWFIYTFFVCLFWETLCGFVVLKDLIIDSMAGFSANGPLKQIGLNTQIQMHSSKKWSTDKHLFPDNTDNKWRIQRLTGATLGPDWYKFQLTLLHLEGPYFLFPMQLQSWVSNSGAHVPVLCFIGSLCCLYFSAGEIIVRVGTVSSYLFREPREGATGCHCVPGTSDDGTRDERKQTER